MSGVQVPVLTFLGAARTVTGSKTLLDTPHGRLLIDCGLFQGRKQLRLANWDPFPVAPESIDAVVLTHAHVDHCGYLPRLVRQGFTGPVWCTQGTAELAGVVLPDSGHLHEEEAAYANRRGFSKHDPAEPLYTEADARSSLELMRSVDFDEQHGVIPGVDVIWRRAGHILGAASVEIQLADFDLRATFSGDLGRASHPILLPPEVYGTSDVAVVESTYGDEDHPDGDPEVAIEAVVNGAVDRGGVVIVPAFAVDRTEVVLWHLDRLVAAGRIPSLPVYVDSPMASRALDLYREAVQRRSAEIRPELFGRSLFSSLDLTETRTKEASIALNDHLGPMIIISASGMATGGRVVHHLARRIGDDRNVVMLVGYQAPGTRGDQIRRGATQLKMLGRYHPVRAEVAAVPLSTHADRAELVDWVRGSGRPHLVMVNHGEQSASEALARAIQTDLGLSVVVPAPGERIRLDRA